MSESVEIPKEAEDRLAYADFTDGERARVQRVAVGVTDDALLIVMPDGGERRWSFEVLRKLPDQADLYGLVLYPADDPLLRLTLSDRVLCRDIRARAPFLTRRPPVENWGAIWRWAAGAVTSVAVIIFVLVPILANQLALFIPPKGEQALGEATFEQIQDFLGSDYAPVQVCEQPEGRAALETMIERIGAETDLPYDITVTVLNHQMVNAFALPGGQVTIFRGLLEDAGSADEVAAVLAHEIGHVVNRDPTRDALRTAGSVGVLGLLFGDFAGGTVVLMLTNQLINAQYSQAAETRADQYATEIMTRGGYDAGAIATFFERLEAEHGDVEGLGAHFLSHPQMRDRIEASQAARARAGFEPKPVLNDAEWAALRGICDDLPEPFRMPSLSELLQENGGAEDGDDPAADVPEGAGGLEGAN